MALRFRSAVHGEMLNRRHGLQIIRVVSLQAAHEGDPVASRQKRIFAVGLLSAPPAWITENIDIGRPDGQPRISLGTATFFGNGLVVLCACLGGNGVGHALDEFGIPGRGETDGLRKYRGNAISRHAVQRLVPPIIRGDVEARNGRACHHQLGDFFLYGEAADQILHALRDRQVRIAEGQVGFGSMPRDGQAERKTCRQSGKGRKAGDFHITLVIAASMPRHGFFAKGVLAFQQVGVKIGTLWLEAAALTHRTAVRSEGVKRGPRRGRLQGLDGGTQRSSLGALHGHHRVTEDIGEDLAPDRALTTTTSETDFRGFEAEGFHAAQTIGHAESHAFHRRAGEVGGCDV